MFPHPQNDPTQKTLDLKRSESTYLSITGPSTARSRPPGYLPQTRSSCTRSPTEDTCSEKILPDGAAAKFAPHEVVAPSD
jgi:hypothetical protein